MQQIIFLKSRKKKTKIKEIKDYSYDNRALIPNKKTELNIGEILVLDQMIEQNGSNFVINVENK